MTSPPSSYETAVLRTDPRVGLRCWFAIQPRRPGRSLVVPGGRREGRRRRNGRWQRYLVVANQTLGAQELGETVRELVASGPCSFHIVVPATPPTEHLTWTEEDAHAIANDRLVRAIYRFLEFGAEVDGVVGDANPMLAISDALHGRRFDHIILCTLPPGISRWLKMDLPARVRSGFGIPVTDTVSSLDRATR